jgi:hypothetical protein
MQTNLSNVTPEQFEAHKAELEKQRKCKHCGADRDAMMRMHAFGQSIIDFLRDARLVKRESCIQCVEKHVGKALVLHGELLRATDENNVNVGLNHLEIIGNLQAALDEAEAWPELWAAIDVAEREYRYKGVGPDWVKLAEKVNAVKAEEKPVA